jgi:hypothetical protein
VDQIVTDLEKEYRQPRHVIESDVTAFVEDLVNRGLCTETS